MANSAFDIYLGDIGALQGYRCRSFVRDSAPLVASRFSTGSAGQTDLDLLKSASLDSVAGGMFQRYHVDPKKAARAVGVFNRYDENLYPAPPRSTATAVSGGYYASVKAESDSVSFIAYASFSAGTYYNLLYKMTYGGGYAAITLPVALQNNGFTNITGMALHKKYLYVASQGANSSANMHRYDIGANTWQDITAGAVFFASMRGVLYVINNISDVYSVTNEEAAGAATYTKIDTAGSADFSSIATDMKEFNGALWIAKPDGIFRFDGVKAIKVLSMYTQQLQVFNGALYFVSGNWLYKFDGANVTRVQFFGNQEVIGSLGLASNSDYLFVTTVVLTSAYVQNDKVGASASGLKRIYTYDGAAFCLLQESAETVGTSYNAAVVTVHNRLYDFFGTVPFSSWATNWYVIDLTQFFQASSVTSNSKLEITISEFDDGFPNIYKTLEAVEANYSGMIAGDSLVVSYQYYDGKVWSSWISAGTITSTSANLVEITDATKKLFKRLKINITATLAAGSTLSLKGCSWRYTLQPRMRWRWQANIMAEGNSTTQDRTGAQITNNANALANSVVKSIKQKTPLFLLAPDYGLVKAQITNAALTFIVKGQVPIYTDPYNEYPLVAVMNNSGAWEVLRVATISYVGGGTNETTITVLERGYWGVTAAQINANAEFHLAYKVYVTRLLRDAPELNDVVYNEQATGESQLQREFLLEVTEV